MKALGWIFLITVLVAVLSPISVWLGTHLTLQYLEWFIPKVYATVTYIEVLGWVAFFSLIAAALKHNTKTAEADTKGMGVGEAVLTQFLIIVVGWWLMLGVLWVSGWYTHWIFYP
jgi:hypothetical protein